MAAVDFLECFGAFQTIIPVIDREKTKYWEPNRDLNTWHRFAGPAIIGVHPRWQAKPNSLDWYFNGVRIKNHLVDEWCDRREIDAHDLSDEDAMIMWSEIL